MFMCTSFSLSPRKKKVDLLLASTAFQGNMKALSRDELLDHGSRSCSGYLFLFILQVL